MFEIRFVALPGGLLPSLFKPRSEGPKWPYPRGSWVWSIEIHRQYEKNSSVSEQLGSDAWKLVYWGLHSWAPLSLLKWWPHIPKSSAALGFGFELLNSGERFRAIVALLFLLRVDHYWEVKQKWNWQSCFPWKCTQCNLDCFSSFVSGGFQASDPISRIQSSDIREFNYGCCCHTFRI